MHLVMMENDIKKYEPKNVVIDPITDLSSVGGGREVKSMLTRLNDLMKAHGITIIFTDLIRGDLSPEHPGMYISSLIDTWILLRNFEFNGERNRGMTILKSRGMPHSNQIKEFVMSNEGIELLQPYVGPAGVLMGSAKVSQEAKDNLETLDARRDVEHLRVKLEEKHRELDARIEALKAQFKAEENELERNLEQKEQDVEIMVKEREVMSRARKS
jgi:circadian clock protein KaiC